MSTQDLIPSTDIRVAYSDIASPKDFSTPWNPTTLDPGTQILRGFGYCESTATQEYEMPLASAYGLWLDDSMSLGYDFSENESNSSHQLRLSGTETKEVYRSLLLRLVCHYYVDLIKAPYLEDLFGNIGTTFSYQQEMDSLPPRRSALPSAILEPSVAKQYESPPLSFDEE
jgi:hypothetical protein